MDQGNTWSDVDIIPVNVTDELTPDPIITVNNIVITDNISILTNQLIQFSASRTIDNVPVTDLDFQWDWGDGTFESGQGLYIAQHEWGSIDKEIEVYNLTLSVFDGFNTGQKTIEVYVNNRVPYQIFAENLTTYTYTSLIMPDIFTDDDGTISQYDWSFSGGVNLDGGITDQNDDFLQTTSNIAYPTPSWNTPGLKTVTLTVSDDDGSQSSAQLFVNVLNQLPIADFTVTWQNDPPVIDFRSEDGLVDIPYTFDGKSSTDIDSTTGDSSQLTYNWSFSDGTYKDKPIVTFYIFRAWSTCGDFGRNR